jgi:hypothetical protein
MVSYGNGLGERLGGQKVTTDIVDRYADENQVSSSEAIRRQVEQALAAGGAKGKQ